MGSRAVPPNPALRDGPYAPLLRATGLNPIGTTAMPPFGWTAATERQGGLVTRNPWDTDRTSGGSSGGSASLVAAGALPIAHANDGGGSIRIPAAVTGLVGFKPSRGRHPDEKYSAQMPIPLISQGVVSRSVRDSAAYLTAIEAAHRPDGVPPIGRVAPAPDTRLRIGLVEHSPAGGPTDPATVAPGRAGTRSRRDPGPGARLLPRGLHRLLGPVGPEHLRQRPVALRSGLRPGPPRPVHRRPRPHGQAASPHAPAPPVQAREGAADL